MEATASTRERVDVVLVDPEKGVGNQEIPHLVAAEVEDQRPPIGVGAHRTGVLVEVRPIEIGQGEVVPREMGGHPVHDDADVLAVQCVNQGPEVVRAAKTRRSGRSKR